jgi:hypothetical protein
MRAPAANRPRPLLPSTAQRRALNDTLRRYQIGGRIMISSGLASVSEDDLATVLWAVRKFDAFDSNVDPADHSFGHLNIRGYNIIFKINGGASGLVGYDLASAERVLTVMMANEY